ncbi:MAG: hypothetical protein EXR71_14715 [Myxococcales bacterium]|nr:hypothetical protein [Myxococcales bacterium]
MIWWALAALAAGEDPALIGQLDREVIALRQKVERLEEQLATCSTDTTPDPAFVELRSLLKGHPATVARDGRRTVVTLPLDTLFSPEGRDLRMEAEPTMDLFATAMSLHPEWRVTVRVHLDSPTVPPPFKKQFSSVWELSAWRAAATVGLLIERFSVPASMLTAAARADQEPASADGTPEARSLNRRVVFMIEPGASP